MSGTTTNLIVGIVSDTNRFVETVDVVATAGNRVVGVTQTLTLTSTQLLAANAQLVAVSAGTADTGEAIISVRLRPVELSRGNASKRPSADADSPT